MNEYAILLVVEVVVLVQVEVLHDELAVSNSHILRIIISVFK